MHKIMAQKEIMNIFSDNENFERGPPRHAGGNGNQGINFVWPYVLNKFFAQYKHTYGQQRASDGSHMKAAHTVLYMKKHTQTYASYPAMDISCMSVV